MARATRAAAAAGTLLVGLLGCLSCAAAKNWVLLVAGSNTYDNYRHQSDICHAYRIVTEKGGIPKENVVTFMYNDIAENPRNPFKGNIINHPNGTNNWPFVKDNIDYQGKDVNAANILAVLSGDKEGVDGGNGKVIEATEEDKIFFYFADHGAPGLIAMP